MTSPSQRDAAPVVEIENVDVFVPVRSGDATVEKLLLEGVTWTVRAGEHWAVLGPNGAGKSTLLSLAAARRHPSRGVVTVLGGRLGKVDISLLHKHIGLVDWRLGPPEYLDVATVVLTGLTGTILPRQRGTDVPEAGAREALSIVGGSSVLGRRFGTLSRGERARVVIARALVASPAILLLDEPASGLDLLGREDLLQALEHLACARPELATVVVAHLLEEVAPSVSHALLLSRGQVVDAGRASEVLTDDRLSECFERPISVHRRGGRWTATALPR